MKTYICVVPLLMLTACSGANSPIIISSSCAMDHPTANAELLATQPFDVGGWAFDKESGTVPDKVRIQLRLPKGDVIKTIDAKRGTRRPDVAKVFNLPAVEVSGFDLVVPANSLAPGAYEVAILQELPNAILICASHGLQVK